MAQFANFLNVPTEQPDNSGYADMFTNIMQGYKNAATPSMINQQLKGMKFANKLAEMQSSDENQDLQKRFKEAQIANMNRPAQPRQETEFVRNLQAYQNMQDGDPNKEMLGDWLKTKSTRGNGITIGTDPETGRQTVQIGGGQSGIAKSSSGEEPYYEEDPETGEKKQVGFSVKPTSEDIKEHSGRAYINTVLPFINESTSRYSGKGGNEQFMSDINNFSQDKQAQDAIINYMTSVKLLSSSAVKEASTLSAPNTQKVFKQLEKSINSSDLPKTLEKVGKEYLLPPSAAKMSADSTLDWLNKATQAGQKAIPARIIRRFGNESQKQPTERMFKSPDGKMYTMAQINEMRKNGELK